ncbi:YitT family protein [Clostridium hydrogeniformans]|uniref:YitT family protein n=1 Tax=Clostridium hydrogeniformans TaxID=349933 RepID=UPI0004879DC7|nr:YitT family protein [Clostridium hydrogeniformans]
MNINKENLTRVCFVLLGSFICSVSINGFSVPYKLLSGGVSGIALIIQYVTGLQSGYLVLLINIPIFILGFKKADREFVTFSFIGMIALSTFLILTKDIGKYIQLNDIVISTLFGGVLYGFGVGLVFRNRASQGGSDIIAFILKNSSGMDISKIDFIINVIVVFLGAVVGDLRLALYTLLLMYIKSVLIHKVIVGFDKRKALFIVSDKHDEIAEAIMLKIGRGVTMFYGEGAYTREDTKVLYCVVSIRELARTKSLVEKVDNKVLMSIMDVSEMKGNGFLTKSL